MAKTTQALTAMTSAEVDGLVKSLGQANYRAKQLTKWIYRDLAFSYGQMTDLPAAFREKLAATANLHTLTPAHEETGRDGTVKVLFNLADGLTIEAALMSYPKNGHEERGTVCVSTQVGCAIGCPFCATGRQGFTRNLTAGEIIDQVLFLARRYREQREGNSGGNAAKARRPGNIVFMGMGEPLANYDALLRAIGVLNSPEGFGLGARNMVVSTAGLVPQIRKLGGEKYQVGLAVSLHAGDNALRDRLVPVNRKYPLEQLIRACRDYYLDTGRRVSFEYAPFKDVNDKPEQAQSLARLLRGLNCHVNLIAANDAGDPAFRPPLRSHVLHFETILRESGINTTLRQPRGQDIAAGCGQLRSRIGFYAT